MFCLAEVDPVQISGNITFTSPPPECEAKFLADDRASLLYPVTRFGARLIGQHAPRPVMRCDSERSKRGRLTNPDDLRGRSWRSKHGRLWKISFVLAVRAPRTLASVSCARLRSSVASFESIYFCACWTWRLLVTFNRREAAVKMMD